MCWRFVTYNRNSFTAHSVSKGWVSDREQLWCINGVDVWSMSNASATLAVSACMPDLAIVRLMQEVKFVNVSQILARWTARTKGCPMEKVEPKT